MKGADKMKRYFMFTAVIILLFCGCSSGTDITDISDKYAAVSKVSAQVSVSAYSGVSSDYKLAYERSDSKGKTTILEPAGLAGITAEIDGQTAKMIYGLN